MKLARNKTTAVAVSLFLMFAIATSLIVLPLANAHDPAWEIATFAFINAAPNPVGVGQHVNVIMWLDKRCGDAAAVNDIRFHDYKLTITKPDDTTETKTWDVTWDTTSAQYFGYSPSDVGTYTFKFEYPGQTYTWSGAYQGDHYSASSATTTLTVQEDPIPDPITSYPLPTEYWSRPIYSENTDWWAISSNWLGSGSPKLAPASNFGKTAYLPDGVGPKTAHIMWTKPIQSGGVVGGDDFSIRGDTYFEGSAYINRFSNPIIIGGKLYYTEPLSYSLGTGGPTKCVDLRTGEEIWRRADVPSLSFAYIFGNHQMNQHGVWPAILCTSNFAQCFDADTGENIFNVTGVPSGAAAMGPEGEVLRYVIENAGTAEAPDYRLGLWNSSLMVDGFGYAGSVTWRPSIPAQVDASISDPSDPNCRYSWNVSIPWRNTMTSNLVVLAAFPDDLMLLCNGTLGRLPGISAQGIQDGTPITYFAVNLNPDKGAIGSVLWRKTWNPPAGNKTVVPNAVDPVNRVFLEEYRETVEWIGYSLDNGEKLWGPTPSQAALEALDYYGNQFSGHMLADIAYDNFYSVGFAGVLYCYDIKTGNLKWTYGNGGEGNSTDAGYYAPRGNYPTMTAAIGDGVIYLETTEHTVTTPVYKGARTRAVNATDGTELWTLSAYIGGGRSMAAYGIADGYATYFNGYDNQIYCVGKGPSATTVAASPKISVHGDCVLVEGTVIDTAAGTELDEQAARFPYGVPAVSDANMTAWMEYVYQQKPLPSDITGVDVIISVLDPNQNSYEVARTTSDASGYFGCMFEPEVPGFYKIIATFGGSESYWGSFAETFVNVKDAPQPTPVPTSTPASAADLYLVPGIAGIIVAIAVVGAILVLMLRKR